jgi:hypothetical protein
MKTLIALGFLVSLSALAFVPKGIHCRDINGGGDQGYEALFNNRLDKVSISEQSIAGPRHVALLDCSTANTLVNCSEPVLRDAGYSFSMKPSDKGVMQAALYEITFAGSKKLADLVCQRLNP